MAPPACKGYVFSFSSGLKWFGLQSRYYFMEVRIVIAISERFPVSEMSLYFSGPYYADV